MLLRTPIIVPGFMETEQKIDAPPDSIQGLQISTGQVSEKNKKKKEKKKEKKKKTLKKQRLMRKNCNRKKRNCRNY